MTVAPLLTIAFCGMLAGLLAGRAHRKVWLGATMAGAGAAFLASVAVLAGGAPWEWRGGFLLGGEPLHLRLDGISAFFLILVSVVGGASTIYGQEYWSDEGHPRSARTGRMWWSALLLSIGLILTVSNGLHFVIAWEIFTVSSYFLITLDRQKHEVREAGSLFLWSSHAATLCLFVFFAALAARTGSWEIGPMREHRELAPLFWLALLGFGLKAGLFPLHIWLPSAHANAPSHVSAVMSGVTIKLGIYGLVRFSGWLPMPVGAGWVVAALGAASAVLGVAFALGQHDLKRLLAYHSVENIGIILIGLGFAMVAAERGEPAWGALALAGGLLHVWNHGLFKALLFFGAGSVLHTTGTREISRLGGLWRNMPWTAGLFALGAAAISGLPPLNGFVSEWLVYLGLFDATLSRSPSSWAAIPAAILLGMTGALALACFVKVCGVVFLGAARSTEATHAHECGWAMRGSMLALAAGCVAIGLAPVLFWPAIARAVETWHAGWIGARAPVPLSLLGRVHLVVAGFAALAAWGLWQRARRNGLERAVTWDCGYAAPSPRMQYTAGSFAGIITGWFAWILRPERHAARPEGLFPGKASFEEHTPETVLEMILEPAGRMVLAVSSVVRRFQHGRVQAYILYVLAGLAALAALSLWRG